MKIETMDKGRKETPHEGSAPIPVTEGSIQITVSEQVRAGLLPSGTEQNLPEKTTRLRFRKGSQPALVVIPLPAHPGLAAQPDNYTGDSNSSSHGIDNQRSSNNTVPAVPSKTRARSKSQPEMPVHPYPSSMKQRLGPLTSVRSSTPRPAAKPGTTSAPLTTVNTTDQLSTTSATTALGTTTSALSVKYPDDLSPFKLDRALIAAATSGTVGELAYLLRRGADILCIDDGGMTALDHAKNMRNTECAKFLTDKGGDLTENIVWGQVSSLISRPRVAPGVSALNSQIEQLHWLMKKVPNKNVTASNKALEAAADSNEPKLLTFFLHRKVDTTFIGNLFERAVVNRTIKTMAHLALWLSHNADKQQTRQHYKTGYALMVRDGLTEAIKTFASAVGAKHAKWLLRKLEASRKSIPASELVVDSSLKRPPHPSIELAKVLDNCMEKLERM